MSKKGMLIVEAAFLGTAVSLIISSMLMAGSFREKKAIKMCGGTDRCVEMVKGMSPAHILDYIKDR